MPIKSISYSPLNFGFKVLLIISIFYSCTHSSTQVTSDKVKNPGLEIPSNEEIPTDWNLETNNNFLISKLKIDSLNKLFISSTIPGEIRFSQTLTLDSGDYFLMSKYAIEVEKGMFYIVVKDEYGVNIVSSESADLRTLFFIPMKEKKEVSLQFGFIQGSVGNALIETIEVLQAEYNSNSGNNDKEKINSIEENLSLSINQDQFLDETIDLYAKSINTAFLSKDKEKKQALISTYGGDLFNSVSTSYLSTFINNKDRSAYCHKSSLSLDELLRLYQIPTRQLHWQKNGVGFHQFLEYWNSFDKQWKIIDPYYGVRYIDENGAYIGFEEVEAMVRHNKFSSQNIKQLDIGRLYYSEKEILEGWMNAGLAVYILNK